jgi:SAM-dependent methyltransferase
MKSEAGAGDPFPDQYRTLGAGYVRQRRPDPRIEALIGRALGDAGTVVNVGAGTGSYEPPDRSVLAVEPSATMLAQRRPGSAPAVRAAAEALPLRDGAVDGGLAVLTVHHWRDAASGIAELVRVSRRQVVLTWDPAFFARAFWLVAHYLPEIAHHEADLACLDTVTSLLARHHERVEVLQVPVPADCTDGFLGAYWCRPQAYLDPAVRASASGLATLPPGVVGSAMDRLSADLAGRRWQEEHRDLLGLDALDLGYRLVVAG